MKRKLLALIMTAAVLLTAVSCGRKIEQDPVSGAQGTASGTQGAAENEDLEASVRVTYEALTAEQMEKQADLIVIGTASGDFSYVPAKTDSSADVYTDFTVNVQQTVKGVAGDSITVRIRGGKQDGLTVSSSEEPLEKGQKYLLYLKKADDGGKTVYYCINGIHGCFKTDGDGIDFEGREVHQEVEQLYLNAVSDKNKPDDSNETQTENKPTKGVAVFPEYAFIPAQELEESADLILVGEFTGKEYQIVNDRGGESESVYTDHVMKTLSVLKGEAGAEINVRIFGGVVGDTAYSSHGGDPHFEEGGRYLMFLNIQDNAVTENGAECYFLIAGDMYCFKVDADGGLDLKNVIPENDARDIDSLYKSKVDTKLLALSDK
ncbi:MAG: hypothetical protein J6K66_02395 [Clostridia bacterium]|nr:hypothetical protein [Clostridia bacterium]